MEVVINIPKSWEKCNNTFLRNCIRNGKALPAGHGRLIDADALTKDIDTFQNSFVINFARLYEDTVVCIAPTVVKADKEVDNAELQSNP